MAKKAKEKEDDRPSKTQIPPVTKARELRNIRYPFKAEELAQKSKQLAQACTERTQIEDQKKSVVSDYKAKIDSKTSEVNLLSNHITNGYEMRNVECEVVKDFVKGEKTYSYDGVVYDTVPLTAFDRQTELALVNKQRDVEFKKNHKELPVVESDHKAGPVKESDIPGARFNGPTPEEEKEEPEPVEGGGE